MSKSGYVYALINSSFQGLVKVGKTSKDPHDRAKELSSATGVPTPFMVAYRVYVNDCLSVEQYIHDYLSHKGYRTSDNREFFAAPLEIVIDAMLMAREHAPQDAAGSEESPSIDHVANDGGYESGDFASMLYDEACDFFYGDGDKLQDYEKALELYKRAANMGKHLAYQRISSMYLGGQGCKADINKAISYAKKGLDSGCIESAAFLANIYTIWGIQYNIQNINNAAKCYDIVFNSNIFNNTYTDDMKTLHGTHYIKILYLTRYVKPYVADESIPINYILNIAYLKDDILENIATIDEAFEQDGQMYKFARQILEQHNDSVDNKLKS